MKFLQRKNDRKGAQSSKTKSQPRQKSRKQLRKEKRTNKKIEKARHFNRYQENQYHAPPKDHKMKEQKIKSNNNISKKLKPEQKNKSKLQQIEDEDDKLIKMYESKLGIDGKKQKYSKLAQKEGFDDDLFDFLDNISKKVKGAQVYNNQNDQNQNEEEDIQQNEDQNSNEVKDQFDQMFDNLQNIKEEQFENEMEEENQQEQEEISQKMPPKQDVQTLQTQKKQIRKAMNGQFNKLSDGNIMITFRQFMEIFTSHPRSLTIPIFIDLFMRFNLLVEKPLMHVLLTNIALTSGLHQAIGNRLMAPLIYELSKKFNDLGLEEEDQKQITEIGYSKIFQKRKNYVSIVCNLYNFGSLTGQFIESFVNFLSKNLNKDNIQFLYLTIQKSGPKIRQNDPSILKAIIQTVKSSIKQYLENPVAGEEQRKKINIIETELNQIKFNKKSIFDSDQRMAFLQTFLTKNIANQVSSDKQILTLTFNQILNSNTSTTNWWQEAGQRGQDQQNEDENVDGMVQISKERRELLDLAKSLHMVTESRRNIFMELVDSKDYLQATQRILELKVKNIQQIATVLAEVCTLEPNFNPFYALVASKIAILIPKFRLNLQYAIWDRIKLIDGYELRRISNLAKFMARIIADSQSNCSLSMLKYFPDLLHVSSQQNVFLTIFFTHFFQRVNKDNLSKLVGKLRQKNNRDVKIGIKEYLAQFIRDCKDKEYFNMIKLARKLLLIQVDENTMERDAGDIN